MPKILQLDPHVADMIAAGEVVERPASVVKELLENAADAGAALITLEIRAGGMTYIRVTDDGCGMSAQDARTAFLRHATSKLRDERGLEAIGTLGFRGEALAAISAVSRVELLTKEPGSAEGVRLLLEAGKVVSESPAGCPDGTTIIVRDLFFNTPARQKFMKTDRAEAAAVAAAATRFALSRPELSVRYLRDGQEEFHSPGDGSDADCVYSLLGRDLAGSMLRVGGEASGVRVSGFICAPRAARGNRSMQIFFVNGRSVKSRILQAALEQAYRNQLFTGRYPSCVLYLTMSLAAVDVNVHPAKTEVRFLREKEVFDAVYYSVLGALDGGSGTASPQISPSTASLLGKTPEKRELDGDLPPAAKPASSGQRAGLRGRVTLPAAGFKRQSVDDLSLGSFRQGVLADGGAAPYRAAPMPSPKKSGFPVPIPSPRSGGQGIPIPEPEQDFDVPPAKPPVPPLFRGAPESPAGPEDAQEQTELQLEKRDWRVAGEALSTYILVDTPDALVLIDKHAAHERVIFDRLQAQREPAVSQPLLAPVILRPAPEDLALLLDNRALLTEYGFELDDFGGGAAALRAVPIDMDLDEAPGVLEGILEELRQGGGDPAGFRDAVLHTVACKAAIKAGRNSDLRELEQLAEKVMSGAVRYCPHGRPVSVRFPRQELDHRFKRS